MNQFGRSFILLKGDGTLWHWGTNNFSSKYIFPSLKTLTPQQIGRDSDWTAIVPGVWNGYAWKKDGTAWTFVTVAESATNAVLPAAQLGIQRCPFLDNARWLAFSDCVPWHHIGLREDGTLWTWQTETPDPRTWQVRAIASPKLVQIGKDNDWEMLGTEWDAPSA